MRHGLALFFALILALPLAAADLERGSGIGMNLGVTSVGTWDVYHFAWPALGVATIRLSAAQPPAPIVFSDYDLILYHQGALDDGSLAEAEIIARSTNGGATPERIDAYLGPGTFVVAVAPFQAQNEQYTLTTSDGDLQFATTAIGSQSVS